MRAVQRQFQQAGVAAFALICVGCCCAVEEVPKPPSYSGPPAVKTIGEAAEKLKSLGFTFVGEDTILYQRVVDYSLDDLPDSFSIGLNVSTFDRPPGDTLGQIALWIYGPEDGDVANAYAKAIEALTSLVPDAEEACTNAIENAKLFEDIPPRNVGEGKAASGWDITVVTYLPYEESIEANGHRSIVAKRVIRP